MVQPFAASERRSGHRRTGGYANVVVFGPNAEKKYVAPNSSRNGSSVVVAPGTSHRQAKAAAIATKPPACSSLRPIRSMVAAAST